MVGTGDYLATGRIHIGDVRELAGRLEPRSVQTIVTSPPYYGLRSYLDADHPSKARELGGEETPAEFVANLVAVFAALRPALKDDGTIWCNLGDSYAVNGGGRSYGTTDGAVGRAEAPGGQRKAPDGYPPKCLLGMPWRVAFALIDDGWILRSDVIWAKPAPMPESVTDRPTRSHEYLFLLSKSPTYFYDAAAIAEKATHAGKVVTLGEKSLSRGQATGAGIGASGNGLAASVMVGGTRNKRSVWTINSAQFAESHFATFPPDLVRPCILAGTSAAGECVACGKAWVREVERETNWQERKANGAWAGNVGISATYQNGVHGAGMSHDLGGGPVRHLGWAPQCRCNAPTRPQVVCDPFGGSGTTAAVAHELGRDWLLTDLDERALKWTADRMAKMPVGTLPLGAA